jgi:metallophosphoesterase superfamily enzyme
MLRVLDEWLLTPWRVAVHEPTETAIIADVHLGYREARQASGEAVPLLSHDVQLQPLREAHDATGFRRLVVAGDLFERDARISLLKPFVEFLAELGIDFLGLVPGNHDRGWRTLAGVIPLYPDGIGLASWTVIHSLDPFSARRSKRALNGSTGDDKPSRLVSGHEHPAVRWQGRRLPCYVVAPRRVLLPAFSADASGHLVEHLSGWSGARVFATNGFQLLDAGRVADASRRRISVKS